MGRSIIAIVSLFLTAIILPVYIVFEGIRASWWLSFKIMHDE